MDSLLWWMGWRPGVMLITALLVGAVAAGWSGSVAGFVASVPLVVLWVMGTQHINKSWRALFNGAADGTADSGAAKLNVGASDASRHVLVHGVGGALLVTPARTYYFTPLYVGEKFLGVYEGAQLDLVRRKRYAGRGTRELYYRHINSVDYVPPFFTVRTSNGEALQYQSAHQESETALNAVRHRLRLAS
jgi:hypothetical protein